MEFRVLVLSLLLMGKDGFNSRGINIVPSYFLNTFVTSSIDIIQDPGIWMLKRLLLLAVYPRGVCR